MSTYPNLAAVATLIADPARASMLSALLGDVGLPAGELARLAKITPQTASAHLAKLVKGNLLSMTTRGRHHYFRLRDKNVAQVLESLALIAPPTRTNSLNDSLERKAIQRARTCYDHLAGTLGVNLTEAFIDNGFIQHYGEAYEVTGAGENWFNAFGIDCLQLHEKRRAFARSCLDWSERKPHIAGALGAAILQRFLELNWIIRVRNSRTVKVTELGRHHFKSEFGLDWK
ncbi:MAG TPA: helix-turn-helix domain-containing protein [Anaerolineales bacterium]|nr:helix-turn-helix domain-containing protein [Anaerolineales bacterium]